MAAFKFVNGYLNNNFFVLSSGKWAKQVGTSLALIALVAGCAPNPEGDGGSTGGVSGLEMATTMSVVTPVSEGPTGSPNPIGITSAQKLWSIIKPYVINTTFPVGSDYNKDRASVYAWNDSLQQMNVVNFVLCMLSDANITGMVNQGPYVAIINLSKCVEQTFGDANEEQLIKVVVTSARAFENSPQFVRIWVPLAGNDPKATADNVVGGALLQLVINETASATAPFGKFKLSFALDVNDPTGNFSIPNNLGTIRTVTRTDGKSQFKYVFELGDRLAITDNYQIEAASALLNDAAGTSGVAKTFDRNIGTDLVLTQNSNDVAYNPDFFYRKKLGIDTGGGPNINDEECFDRSNPYINVWDYRLYHEANGMFRGKPVKAGQRVELLTNLYFDYTDPVGGGKFYGSLENDNFYWNGDLNYDGKTDLIPDGLQVQVTNWDTNVIKDYIINNSEGRLDRRRGKGVLVSSLAGQKLFYYGPYSGTPSLIGAGTWDNNGRLPGNFGFEFWEVTVDPGFNFIITGGGIYDPMTYQNVITPVTNANINQPVNNDSNNAPGVISGEPLRINSPSLGELTYKEIGAPAGARLASYVTYGVAAPYEAGLNGMKLYCYRDCPIGGIAAPQDAAPGANYWKYPPFGAPVTNTNLDGFFTRPANEGGGRSYTLVALPDGSKYRIQDDSNGGATVYVTDVTNMSYGYLRTGEMVTSPLLDVYHPTVNNIPPYNNVYDVYNLGPGQSSFAWLSGTGNNDLAHTATDVLTSQVVKLEDPLTFDHMHHASADPLTNEDRNGGRFAEVDAYDNQFINLTFDQYLYGLPWHYLPYMDTQVWVNSVNFKNGVHLDTTENLQTYNFVLKASRIEEVLLPIVDGMGVSDLTPCNVLNLADINTLTIPGTDDLDPMIIDFSDMPIGLDTPPRVVEGEIL